MSEEQIEASRKNGSRGKGPTSERGKNNSKYGAVKNGLFSDSIVLPLLGERPEDYAAIKKKIWERFQPNDFVTEMLSLDLLNAWWQKQRIHRAERAFIDSAILENTRAFGLPMRDDYWAKNNFLRLYHEKASVLDLTLYFVDLGPEMDEVRSVLKRSPSGVTFLIEKVEIARSQLLKQKISNPGPPLALLAACTGQADKNFAICKNVISIIRDKAQEKSNQRGESQVFNKVGTEVELDPTSMALLEISLLDVVVNLKGEKIIAEQTQNMLQKLQIATTAIPKPKILDRLARAEAAADRKYYKALMLLLSLENTEITKPIKFL